MELRRPLQKSPKIHTAVDSDKDILLLTAFQYEWTECGFITAWLWQTLKWQLYWAFICKARVHTKHAILTEKLVCPCLPLIFARFTPLTGHCSTTYFTICTFVIVSSGLKKTHTHTIDTVYDNKTRTWICTVLSMNAPHPVDSSEHYF